MAKTNLIVACKLMMFVSAAIHVSEGRLLNFRERKDLSELQTSSDQLVPEAPPQSTINADQLRQPSGHVDNFRPTGQGHSPGAGHSFQPQISSERMVKDASNASDQKKNSQPVDSDEVVNTAQPPPPPPPPTRGADDFIPTTPGHSPGAGHSIQN